MDRSASDTALARPVNIITKTIRRSSGERDLNLAHFSRDYETESNIFPCPSIQEVDDDITISNDDHVESSRELYPNISNRQSGIGACTQGN